MQQSQQKEILDRVSLETSEMVTKTYSTSFSLGISALDKSIHKAIYSIYGFVRFADEIVDSLETYNQDSILKDFITDTWKAVDQKISMNPILNSFQWVVNKYNIDHETIKAFFKSMEMDLNKHKHSEDSYKEYIWGSAEVVGLMCLSVFTNGDTDEYKKLKPYAISLGSAFQKVNFLRDLAFDENELGRTYFPQLKNKAFTEEIKQEIIQEIEKDFEHSLIGIKLLPENSRFGVNSAYEYYLDLLKKIKKTHAKDIKNKRIRISNFKKLYLTFISFLKSRSSKFLCLIILSLVSFFPVQAKTNLQKLRHSFEFCDESKQNSREFLELTEELLAHNANNQVFQTYNASALMLNAKYGFNPITKLKNFNTGRKKLDNYASKNLQNPEIRYIRYATQFKTPFFLNYKDNLEEDQLFLISSLKENYDPELQDYIKRFLIEETGDFSEGDFND